MINFCCLELQRFGKYSICTFASGLDYSSSLQQLDHMLSDLITWAFMLNKIITINYFNNYQGACKLVCKISPHCFYDVLFWTLARDLQWQCQTEIDRSKLPNMTRFWIQEKDTHPSYHSATALGEYLEYWLSMKKR